MQMAFFSSVKSKNSQRYIINDKELGYSEIIIILVVVSNCRDYLSHLRGQ